MNRLLLFFLVLLFCQYRGICDTLLFDGQSNVVSGKGPLEQHSDIARLKKQLAGYQSEGWDNYCPYDAEWKIINGALFLTGIKGCFGSDKPPANLDKLFPAQVKNGMVKANWVTDTVWVSVGQPIYIFNNATPLYREEIAFVIEKGDLKAWKRWEYTNADKGPFLEKTDTVSRFIYSRINWATLPGYNSNKVFLTFHAGTGFANHIRVLRGPADSTYAKEATRILSQMNWGTFYLHGKPFKMQWTIPIVFTEEMRKRYADGMK